MEEGICKNEDGVDEVYDWVTPVLADEYKVRCSLCIKSNPFLISNGGIADCKRHAKGKGHMQLIKERSKQKTLSSSSSNFIVGLCEKDKITKAEVLQSLKVVECNMSFASASGDAKRFQEMFPDSDIAKKYCQGETKTKYTIQFSIAPHVRSKLLEDFAGSPFSFKFDEITTSQVKKQYDGYITCASVDKPSCNCLHWLTFCQPLNFCLSP